MFRDIVDFGTDISTSIGSKKAAGKFLRRQDRERQRNSRGEKSDAPYM